ncbi:CPBP family intramembrane glutamic endopeptidase [Saccharopolyspora sp. NPDC049357]|uniref:CPBP family intramembrane glutamic endopeptidase n=1 Tax=Saccharopolyspora sp. NPDC049357 TaxID=3154507 RepID=UPI0034322B52
MVSERDRVDVRGTVWFVVLAYAPAWLLSTPLWLTGEGLSWEWAPVALTLMMLVPAVAAVVVTKWISSSPLRELGLTNAGGIKKWWRYAVLGCVGPLLAVLLSLLVGYLLGVYKADWTGFSGLVEQFGATVVGEQNQTSPTALALTQLGQVFLLGWVHTLPALGEELGWRGYLAKALLPLGQPGSFLTTGVLWGLWHAPILLLGYNYPTVPIVVSFLMMGSFCVLVGTLLSWLRLASGSVWPAAIAHGFLNSAGAMAVIFSQAGHPVDNASVGLLGWSGWIVLILLILVLVMLGRLPVRFQVAKEGISKGVERRSRKA